MAASSSPRSSGRISEFNAAPPLYSAHRNASLCTSAHFTATVLPPAAERLTGVKACDAARLSASLRSAAHRPASPLGTTQRFWFMNLSSHRNSAPLTATPLLSALRDSSLLNATPRSATLRAATQLGAPLLDAALLASPCRSSARHRSSQRYATFSFIPFPSPRAASRRLAPHLVAPRLCSPLRNVIAPRLPSRRRCSSRRNASPLGATQRFYLSIYRRHASLHYSARRNAPLRIATLRSAPRRPAARRCSTPRDATFFNPGGLND